MNKAQPDIHKWPRLHPPADLPGAMRERLLAAMMQEEAACAADEALEHELRDQYHPVPLPVAMQQNLRPILQQKKSHSRRTILWRYAGAAAAVLVLGGVALHVQSVRLSPALDACVSQQRQQGKVPNEHEDTFILKSNDNQSRVVIRVLSHNPAQLTDEVI